MKLEKQVSNKELSQRLKELGVEQESLFYWNEMDELIYLREWVKRIEYEHVEPKDFVAEMQKENVRPTVGHGFNYERFYLNEIQPFNRKDKVFSAFTVAELGEMLPGNIQSIRENGEWLVYEPSKLPGHKATTEADARALMAIYLLENKLI